MATHASILAWKVPWTEEPGGLQCVGPEKGVATHASILAWKVPWTEEPGGLQCVGLQRALHDVVTRAPSLSGQALGGSAQGFTYHPSGDSGLALKSPDLAGVQGKSPSHPLEAVKGRGSSFSCVHLFSRYLLSVSCHATFVASGHKLGFCL